MIGKQSDTQGIYITEKHVWTCNLCDYMQDELPKKPALRLNDGNTFELVILTRPIKYNRQESFRT